MRKLFALLLLLTLLCIPIFSCSLASNKTCSHKDTDKNHLCDICQEQLPIPDCTAHSDADKDLSCDTCATFVDESVTGWLLKEIPSYRGGSLSKALYLAGQGIDTAQRKENESLMQIVSDTNAAEFAAYLSKLEKAGYQKEFYRNADTNLFACYANEGTRVYTYFTSRSGEVKVIREKGGISASLADFGYEYVKKSNEESVLYQFALAMNDETHAKPDFKDNGMLYLLKLADNSVVMIDGGNSIQMTDDRRDALMQMLWDITGKQKGDTVRIAAWYITHAHGDHYGGFAKFTWKYAKYIDLERVCFAFPSLNAFNDVFATGSGADGYRQIIEIISENYADDDPLFLRLHTGQSFRLADASFEVLQTHEDLVDPVTAYTRITNYNDSSSIIRVTVDGATFLFTGDINEKVAMPKILENWSADYLRSDGVQMAHHVMNDISSLYACVRADVLFVPQSPYGVSVQEKRIAILEKAMTYAREDMIFFQSEATVGIAATGGKWEKVYEEPFVY